jgi:hypothetical protein
MRYMHGWERNERAQSTRTGLYGDLKGRYGSRAAPKSRGLFESVFLLGVLSTPGRDAF